MITCKTGNISQKERNLIRDALLDYEDIYRDSYITKNNLRLFIKDNLDILFKDITNGDYIAYDTIGTAIVTGFSDKAKRKYLKVLAKNIKDAEKLIKIIFWNVKCDLYMKIKKNNPLKDILMKHGFTFVGGRGKEMLLVHKGETHVSGNKR